MTSSNPDNLHSSGYTSTSAKIDHTYQTTAMEDSTPLLVATPLYGTTEPETVTFDESTILPAATATVVHDGVRQQPALLVSENDPLLIQATPSADFSAAQSDKVEEPVFRDVPFAILFWVQISIVIALGFTLAPKGYAMMDFDKIKEEMERDPSTNETDMENFTTFVTFVASYVRIYPKRILYYLLVPTGWLSFFLALFITAKLIKPFPKFMVTLSLVGWFAECCIVFGLLIITSPGIGSVVIAIGVLSIVAYYIRTVWRLIPHSAVNLGVALEGVQSNCGIYILALMLVKIASLWAFCWFYVLIGTMYYIGETQCPDKADHDDCPPQGPVFLFLLLSFYWTSQVIMNLIQVTVAGVMATWCFDYGDARGCCSFAIWTSLYRSLTFSFGSICLGSLLMGIVRVIRYFVNGAKQQRESSDNNCEGCGILTCILDCLIHCFEEVLDYFNHWSYVFCGIYGYSYVKSGKMVVELFRARGWENIVNDDLLGWVFACTTFTVGLLSGLAAMCIERAVDSRIEPDPFDAASKGRQPEEWEINTSFLFGPLPKPQFLALGVGFLIGLIVCCIMMSVVRGAVNTLIVCWADSPSRLEENHPEATKDMAETWTNVFPEARVNLTSVGLPSGSPQRMSLVR